MTLEQFLIEHPNLNIGECPNFTKPTWHLRRYEDRWLVWDNHSTPVVESFTQLSDAIAFLKQKTPKNPDKPHIT